MKNYQKINNILGWLVFIAATLVYFLTLEPTASWWDCGEYISTSYKLQVGHPPGAPTFQMLGRLFSLLAFGDTSRVAIMVNSMSALSSSFSILFLFWSITMLGKKVVTKNGNMTDGKMWAIMGSGVVGAMAYTFSDSFWFSAVEGEVYAMSSFFTALVFWAMLKWETVAEEKGSYRWIILIGFLMGLSIGVHLLNLLAIPAIAFIFYFKKYKPSLRGGIITAVLSFIILAFIMYFLIPQIVNLSAQTELFFVNSLGLPFNSGTIFYFIFLTGLILFGLYYAKKKNKTLIHSLVLIFTFILIGYSSFFMLVIRSNANPPIDENDPEDAISLLSYLNREQYGTWPLFYGQYYMAPVKEYADGNPIYQRDDATGKYIITDDRKQTIPVYDPKFCGLFPRMWSNQKSIHVSAYKDWGGDGGIPIDHTKNDGTNETLLKPTFGQNLQFFFSYQIGFMYLRYFMWNFAGRQNDVEGYGSIENGNWISGIPFIDNARLGNQDKLPHSMQNPAKNKFYFLPLLLGLIGLFYHISRHAKDSLIIGLLFFMTGIAIVIYLNQTPYQPRERDYSYAGSFYAFAIWIGLGVLALWDFLSNSLKKINPTVLAAAVTVVCFLLVPSIMGQQGWDDHNRAHKYACRDFAAAYLESCAPNAILITNGDNDTFPLWYAQEVEGVRTDVRVVNFMLASGDWYIHQLGRKMYNSDALPLTIPPKKYDKGVNEYVPYIPREAGSEIVGFINIKEIIDFINSDDPNNKYNIPSRDSEGSRSISYLPTKNFSLPVDSAACVNNGIVPKELAGRIVKSIDWTMKKGYILKNELMLLDFLATNNWKRPLYFASPSTVEDFMNIDEYCHVEGLVYKFMPVKADDMQKGLGGMTTIEPTFNILMNKCKWGNLNDPRVTVDRESYRNVNIPKNCFLRMAMKLVEANRKEDAVKILDRCLEVFPNEKISFDNFMMYYVETYYKAGAVDKANKLFETLSSNLMEDVKYVDGLPAKFSKYYEKDRNTNVSVLNRMVQIAKENKQDATTKKVEAFLATLKG